MDLLIQYAMQFVGVHYKWGGESPMDGFDCSGLVQAILRSAGEDPRGDQTAQALFDHFSENGSWGTRQAGSLVFYGRDTKHITHVGFCIDPYRMIEAGGGGPRTLTREDAIRDKAYVRVKLISSRYDVVAVIKPFYSKIGLF